MRDQQPPSPWRQWDGERAGHLPHHKRSGGSARVGLSLPGPDTGRRIESIHPQPRAPQSARPRAPGVRLLNPTLRQMWPRERPGAAMCVQGIDVQCVLQFTLVNAAGCALHRCTSQVIHRSELYFLDSRPPAGPPGCASQDCTVNRTPRRGGQDGAPNRGCSWAAMSDPGDLTGR